MAEPETIFASPGLVPLAARLATLGTTKVLVLAPPSRRHVAEVALALDGFLPAVFDGAAVHVPAAVVEAATARLVETGADTVVAVGGGSSVGLGKALRLAHAIRFAAIPTTYAGSEMTAMFGITRDRDKQTGRDPRVRPDLVLYDVALTLEMPIGLTVQSLCNAIAHVASVLSTGSLSEEVRTDALAAAATVVHAIERLVVSPGDRAAREDALRGASRCARAFDRGKPGIQHALAHLLGGAFNLDHAALHAVLLPRFLAHLRATSPAIVDDLERAVGHVDLGGTLVRLLARAGAPGSLSALGLGADDLAAVRAERPDLAGPLALAAD